MYLAILPTNTGCFFLFRVLSSRIKILFVIDLLWPIAYFKEEIKGNLMKKDLVILKLALKKWSLNSKSMFFAN